MNKKLREMAVRLRKVEKLSYSEIKKRLGVSKSTLSYWLRDFPLNEKEILELRRVGWAKGEASRERFRNRMREKKEEKGQKIYELKKKELRNIDKESFFVAGLALYLGEGDKRNDTRIVLANTDYRIIKFFIKWLEDFLKIPKSDLRAQLHLYENMELEKEQNFWKNSLGLAKSQFYKTSVRELSGSSFTYSESFRHGTCSLYALGVERKMELMAGMRAFVDIYLEN